MKLYRIALVALLLHLPLSCLFAQSLVKIGNHNFTVRCDETTLTAEILDVTYTPEEGKFPINSATRRVGGLTKGNLTVPAKVTLYGKEYTVTRIGKCAFAGYTDIKNVVIPQSVTEIDDYAFFRSGVEDVRIPSTVRRLGKRIFGHCGKLRSLMLPPDISFSGPDMYGESKNVVLSYSAPARSTGKDAGKAHTASLVSDIDRDLPMASRVDDNTFVVIIANQDYEDGSNVDYALRDGQSFRRYCTTTLGIPAEHVHYRENASLGNMQKEVDWLNLVSQQSRKKANYIFYYAGHGIPDKSRGAYLLPVDGSLSSATTAYSLERLYSSLGNLSGRVLVFIDACFSGKTRSGELAQAGSRGVALHPKLSAPKANMVVFTASQGDETAHGYDSQGHGLFTYYLLKKLKESGGKTSLGELGDYVTEKVGLESAVTNRMPQTPTVTAGQNFANWRAIKLSDQ